jgi:tetratricopeptide (TPR) repeat protein
MFMRAVSLKKDHTEAYNMLGFSLRKSGEYEDAIKNYKKALEINPDFPEAHEYIGEAYLSIGNRDLAWKHYTELRRLESEEAEELLEKIKEFDNK